MGSPGLALNVAQTDAAHARLWFMGARALYVGPSFGLAAHRNAVAVLCVGVHAPFGVARDPHDERAGSVECRSAFIPPATWHRLVLPPGPMAFLYLDPWSADVQAVRDAMRDDRGRFARDHAREQALVTALQALGGTPADTALRQVKDALSLPPPARRDERIVSAVKALREQRQAAQRLDQLAASSGLSPSRFLHLFKQSTGVPLRRFRLWTRLGVAVRRMADGASLTDAALDAGFASSAHFSTAFREMFGMAPSRLVQARLSIADPARP